MRQFFFMLAFTFLLPISSSSTVAKECSREDAIQAELEASTLPDWESVYKSFQQFSHCDDGAIGEGYSEAVGRLLAEDWSHIERLYDLVRRDAEFEKFVLHHVDESVPTDYLRQIFDNAQQRCPYHMEKLCDSIEAVAI